MWRRERTGKIAAQENSREAVASRGQLPLADPRSKSEMQEEIIVRAREARELGEACQPVLEAYGAHKPEAWTAYQLRELIPRLRADGNVHEAFAVERYANARVAWGQAINAMNGQGRAAQGPPRPPKETGWPKQAEPVHVDPVTSQAIPVRLIGGRASGTTEPLPCGKNNSSRPKPQSDANRVAREENKALTRSVNAAQRNWSDGYWVGSGAIPENPPAWHATTPPWMDGPSS
jgi:hypothetical protein